MISFETLQIEVGSPIYQQIVRFVKQGIVAGTIENLEEMPSRRVLSVLLGVNPNTIQKAYRTLEEEGIIESKTGAKSVVLIDEVAVKSIKAQLFNEEIEHAIQAMQQMGISRAEGLMLMEALWKE